MFVIVCVIVFVSLCYCVLSEYAKEASANQQGECNVWRMFHVFCGDQTIIVWWATLLLNGGQLRYCMVGKTIIEWWATSLLYSWATQLAYIGQHHYCMVGNTIVHY